MLIIALSFLLGDLYLQSRATLPSIYICIVVISCAGLSAILLRNQKKCLCFILAASLGFIYGAWYAAQILSFELPKNVEGQPVAIVGTIASIPSADEWQTHFLFSLQRWQTPLKKLSHPVLIRLSLPSNQNFQVGDCWKFVARLRRIHGMQSEGAFDYEAWALQNKIRATGSVVTNVKAEFLSHAYLDYPIEQLRQAIKNRIKPLLPATHTAPWLLALMIGERSEVYKEDWQVLRSTGTNHLMAIAGLHIGLMAGIFYFITNQLWRRSSTLMLFMPAQLASSTAALISALFYSMIAGFSLPTQRACVMLMVFTCAILSRRKISVWHAWSLALFIVLILNPLCILAESFWLSFATIALIIYGLHGRLQPTGLWWKWGRVQWVIGVGLIPLSLLFFQESSLISFIANSIAIPWLCFLILPWCFLATIFLFVSPTLTSDFLWVADRSLQWLWKILIWLASYSLSAWHQAIPNQMIFALTLFGILFLLIPAGLPLRWLGGIWLLPLLYWQPPKLEQGTIKMSLLDVGQGLSVVIQTRSHTLVYDTGAKFNNQMDMGENIVLPYLRSLQIKLIDKLVISHGDNDHAGGLNALVKSLPITKLETSVPEKISLIFPSAQLCLAGETWRWDDVNFAYISPTREMLGLGNDSSCVLRIDNGKHVLILAGDIEKKAERNLLARSFNQLATTMVIAPHHGSKSSGDTYFIEALHPQYILYATGYRNRYHFPHPSIIKKYMTIGAQGFNTAETGTIDMLFKKSVSSISVMQYRLIHARYWYDTRI